MSYAKMALLATVFSYFGKKILKENLAILKY